MYSFFFFNDTPTTEIYTLSLHDALPICRDVDRHDLCVWVRAAQQLAVQRARKREIIRKTRRPGHLRDRVEFSHRSEEHTSELQSHHDLVCRLLLEKKKKRNELTKIIIMK